MLSFYLLSFVIGLAFGSFLNCLIYRLYHKKTLFSRSFCPNCQHQIAWYDNIPILSFIILAGRCRFCRQKISWQYPLVELVTGLLFLAVASQHQLLMINYQLLVKILRDWLMVFALIFIFIYDLRYYIIEDTVLLPLAGLIFILNLILRIPIFNLLLAGVLAVIFFALQYFATKGQGIGLGDLRIGLLMGFYFGWPKILVALILAYLVGALVSLFLIIFKRKKWSSRIPLGPFLAIGSLIALFFGQEILNWYLSKF
jgi:prepilin signal peptidase PulO-like enzyme (type II secretory pathway)